MSAEFKLETSSSKSEDLEAESLELRARAETLNDELNKVRAESKIKVTEYKRQASAGNDNLTEILQAELADKEQELETLAARFVKKT